MASTTKDDIREWFENGMDMGAAYMLVVCDTFDWEDYPAYVMPGEDLAAKGRSMHGPNMQKVMECYNLSKPFDKQDQDGRFVFDGWSPYE